MRSTTWVLVLWATACGGKDDDATDVTDDGTADADADTDADADSDTDADTDADADADADSDADADTGSTAETGGPPVGWNGAYTGTVTVIVDVGPPLNLYDVCTGTLEVQVADAATPQITGSSVDVVCPVLSPGTMSMLDLDGDIVLDPQAGGDVSTTIYGFVINDTWQGTFVDNAGVANLSGQFRGTIAFADYEGSFTVDR
jgi:hypothetical protein